MHKRLDSTTFLIACVRLLCKSESKSKNKRRTKPARPFVRRSHLTLSSSIFSSSCSSRTSSRGLHLVVSAPFAFARSMDSKRIYLFITPFLVPDRL